MNPFLDVTDVLDDPDFRRDDLVCRRHGQVVSDDGLASESTVDTLFSGVAVPTSSLEVVRGAEAEYTKGAVTIFTKFLLTSGQAGAVADTVFYRGTEYTVTTVDDWAFGAGYLQATCEKAVTP